MRVSRTRGVVIGALADWFAIRPMAASMLWTLYKSPPLHGRDLAKRTGCSRHSISVYASDIRGALGDDAVLRNATNVWSAPAALYALTPEGKAQVYAALQELAAELVSELVEKKAA